MMNHIKVYTISDSIGETSQKLMAAVMAQYPELMFDNQYRFPFVTTEEELLTILKDALKDQAIVVSTLVNKELSMVAQAFSQKVGLDYVDLMAPFFKMIHDKTGISPLQQPGRVHQLDTAYFKKIAAIEFAVKYDDGKNPQSFLNSDIVLLGVSRTSKTPLSMYLANKGYKVSNLPLIPEVPLPKSLDQVDSKRIIGLTCDPETLCRIREHRLDSLGLSNTTSYTNLEKIYEELSYANSVFETYGAKVIDVTNKSIEETAYLIEEYLRFIVE